MSALKKISLLSDRERQVLRLVARGLSNRKIAEKLDLTPRTIKFHTGKIYSKLGLKTRAETIVWAWKNGAVGK